MRLLGGGQCASGWYAVPFGQTTTAAGRRGMLSDKDRMPAKRCLLAIVLWGGRREALSDEVSGMLQYRRNALLA
jgi:hypothetical protein